ncbi:MAG: lipopolysaccharide biosynthesis protein [Mycobacteriales bacterium]
MTAAPELQAGSRTGARPFLTTSLGLVVGRMAALGTGFLFWLLAARAASPYAVGVAAGAVSLMMLGTQFAIAGAGSSFILHHARVGERRRELLDAALTIVLLTSAGVALLALLLVALLSDGLRPIAVQPGFAALFIAMTVIGTVGILRDHVSVALSFSTDVVVRNVSSGLLTAAPLLVAAVVGASPGPVGLFSLWVLGGTFACAIGARQLHRRLDGYVFRPRLTRGLTALVLRSGLPNQALTLVERAPNLLLPAVVTEVLSPELNAYWYVAWMMAWGVLIVPVSVGLTLFAQVAKDTQGLHSAVVRAAKTGALLGLAAAAGAAVVGPFILRLLGRDYAQYGTTPLRVLVLGVLPVLVTQLYYAVCRSRERVREALVVGAATAIASVAGTAAVAGAKGLAGMAWVWLAVQVVGAVWAAVRLRVLLRRQAGEADAEPLSLG